MELRLVSSSKKGAQTQLKLKKIRLGPPLKRFQFQKTIPAIFFLRSSNFFIGSKYLIQLAFLFLQKYRRNCSCILIVTSKIWVSGS